jgi:hypothetical protein
MQPTEFVDAVFQIIKTHEQADGLKASKLGQLVRRAFPNEPRKSFGFQTLKDVLAPLEQRGLIRTGEDRDRALAVWLTGETQSPIAVVAPTKKYNPLKSEIWLAFISSKPLGKRYMHRTDGTVRMGLVESPHPADQWVEISQIGAEDQKEWAKRFATTNATDEAQGLIAALDGANWFVEFVKSLRVLDANLARDWNRTRTEKVSACVAKWCEQHKIELSTVFAQRPQREPFSATMATTEGSSRLSPTRDARAMLLAALSRMSTHELSQLQIPAHYLLREVGF